MVLSPHSHCNIEHSERTQSEDSLTDEKRSLALFVRQVMSACLKGYEYKVRVISADEQEAIELNESINALKPYQLYVLIEAKKCVRTGCKSREIHKQESFRSQSKFDLLS